MNERNPKSELKDMALQAMDKFHTSLHGISELFDEGELREGLMALGELHSEIDRFGHAFNIGLGTLLDTEVIEEDIVLNVPPTPPAL